MQHVTEDLNTVTETTSDRCMWRATHSIVKAGVASELPLQIFSVLQESCTLCRRGCCPQGCRCVGIFASPFSELQQAWFQLTLLSLTPLLLPLCLFFCCVCNAPAEGAQFKLNITLPLSLCLQRPLRFIGLLLKARKDFGVLLGSSLLLLLVLFLSMAETVPLPFELLCQGTNRCMMCGVPTRAQVSWICCIPSLLP
jgi:hypothetical protein